MPLLIHHAPDAPLLLGPEGEVIAGAFLAQVQALAQVLPPTRFVVNLCGTRHGFMLGFAVALTRGQTSLFPPGQGRADLDLVLRHYADACIVTDAPDDVSAASGVQDIQVVNVAAFQAIDVSGTAASATPLATAVPDVDANLQAAILFTSGSTGQPAAHAKTWGQLCEGAEALGTALGWREAPPGAIVGSVPSQHMFGLETTVMLPWRHGIAVHHHKPLLPADLEQALLDCARPAWWMTTPVHLRAPLKQPAALPFLEGVVASTMNLPVALASAGENAWRVPVMEIYGATETGALALRRTAREEWWTPLPGVVLNRKSDRDDSVALNSKSDRDDSVAIWAEGSHIGAPVRLADELELGADTRFRWLGRATDLVKVAGKRASLAALNHHLTELPGVEDAVYFLPAHDDADEPTGAAASGAHRLAAFYVSDTLEPRRVLQMLRERVDPVFLPRPLYRVEALPRNANGKLVQSALAELLVHCRARSGSAPDRKSVTPAASDTGSPASGAKPDNCLAASFAVSADHPALPGHFPGNPIVPGAVILARVERELLRLFPAHRFMELKSARFHEPLAAGIECIVRPALQGGVMRFEVRTAVTDALIASGQWTCVPAHTSPDSSGAARRAA